MTDEVDITVIVTGHHEGVLMGPTLASLCEAADTARDDGLVVECIAVLDRASDRTRAMFAAGAPMEGVFRVEEVDLGDQGLARNHGVSKARGRYLAMLDGDDLWSFNWLSAAYKLCREASTPIIVQPEFNIFFENYHGTYVNVSSESELFDEDAFRAFNYWDALCFCERSIFLDYPYERRDIANGFALEDWHWAWETYCAGIKHVVAPDTVHFKRRRIRSQSVEAKARRALPPFHPIQRYAWHDRAKQG
ncbi:glycosyltransferase involved in cell wall biosynthesis [Rhodobium orientis]|uniref:Glycosyltransferase 2-like domain-containing protein n=1 Tax=Rhodobium orientis TaxID=34017 RepID=A0A327JRR3_9HYPH|nr:glycosyltransferase [Rhodobium orientis]MBB4304251.1 glycosyltransferase involved in cell wall biosynthesis [Rhodobium orientis]MBK5948253.1 hypothetical protein [Rhodobium orientis]RAI28761.1 hypothetical protein CH339_04980 [Rhodobium orientis]